MGVSERCLLICFTFLKITFLACGARLGSVDGGPARPFGGLERRRAWGQGSHVDGEDKGWSPTPRRPSGPAPQGGCGLEGCPAQAPVNGTAATVLCEDVLGLPAHSSVGGAALFQEAQTSPTRDLRAVRGSQPAGPLTAHRGGARGPEL